MSIPRFRTVLVVAVGVAGMVWLLGIHEPQPKATVDQLYRAAAAQAGVEQIFQGFRR
ncbi:hypothetical protein [Massilia cavernae]|uniref:hypothetical protein n=1 Tax=Massilia cavernae TaxID=2320864 RepID=UPI00160085B8|nr:hypothetical protein [Massilia cavernae]